MTPTHTPLTFLMTDTFILNLFWLHLSCVPISKLSESILRSKALLAKHEILGPLVGHVGDGNFHIMLLVDPADKGESRGSTN